MNDELAYCDITKIDDDQQLVFGWASIIKDEEGRLLVDRQDDFIEEEGELEKAAYDYVLQSRDGGEMHIRKGVSTMVESVVLTKEKQEAMGIEGANVPVGWWIGFKVNDNRVWSEVKKGGYSGFSVHGKGKRTKQILKDGSYTEVGKNDKGKVERPTPEEEEELKRHEKQYGKAHAELMRQAIRDGATMEASHALANKMSVSKEDCGCDDCSGGSVLVEKRFIELITKAQRMSQAMITKQQMKMKPMPAPYIMPKGSNFCVYDMTGKKVGEYPSIQQAKEKMVSLVGKGDFPGHPFRGNQYTGGIPAGVGVPPAGGSREEQKRNLGGSGGVTKPKKMSLKQQKERATRAERLDHSAADQVMRTSIKRGIDAATRAEAPKRKKRVKAGPARGSSMKAQRAREARAAKARREQKAKAPRPVAKPKRMTAAQRAKRKKQIARRKPPLSLAAQKRANERRVARGLKPKPIIRKGDFPGHPFRGNQHTGGIPAGGGSGPGGVPRKGGGSGKRPKRKVNPGNRADFDQKAMNDARARKRAKASIKSSKYSGKRIRDIKRDYDKLTDANDHNGAAIMLAQKYGTSNDVKVLSAIKARQRRTGQMSQSDIDLRSSISRMHYAQMEYDIAREQKRRSMPSDVNPVPSARRASDRAARRAAWAQRGYGSGGR